MDQGLHIQSSREELANFILHLVGFVLGVTATAALITFAALRGSARHIVSCSLYSATLLFLYLFSTLYHVFPAGKAKNILRIFDHSSVFLLIAGTYTPFTLVTLRGGWGWSLFGSIWGLAVAGILMKVLVRKETPIISTTLYLAMGWLIVIAIKPLIHALPVQGFLWLAAGGIFYSVGIVFFALDRFRYFHAIWHLFVLAGSICHFCSIFFYVLPRPA